MLTTLRLLAALGALLAGCFTSVDLLLLLGVAIWKSLVPAFHWCASLWRPWSSEVATQIVAVAATIPVAPSAVVAHFASVVAGGALTALFLVRHWCTPLAWRIRRLSGRTAVRVPKNGRLAMCVSDLAARAGLRPPSVWVVHVNVQNAFALAAPGRRAIVVAAPLANSLNNEELAWVLAHEIGHLRYGDALVNGFWISVFDVLQSLQWLRARVLSMILRITQSLPLLRLFAFPLALVFILIAMVARLSDTIARNSFLVVDRLMCRRIEYRADAFAAQLVGAAPGAWALARLYSNGETPPFGGLFATHPPMERRIRRLADAAAAGH